MSNTLKSYKIFSLGIFVLYIFSTCEIAHSQSLITGHLKYFNASFTPMDGVDIFLYNSQEQLIDSVKTDQNGYFYFDGLPAGIYTVIPDCNKQWGGVNSLDAMLVQKHFTSINLLNGLPLQAADINGSNSVNSVDALQILQRFVGFINSFDAGDWTFENAEITLDGITNVSHDLYGISYGDVNASFTPKPCIPAPTLANAGPDQTGLIGNAAFLNGNLPLNGTGHWQVLSGTSYTFSGVTIPAATFSGASGNTYILIWNITNECYTTVDTVVIGFSAQTMNYPCPGIPSFNYGGQTYNTVKIGTQCWMKENLNIGTMVIDNNTGTQHSHCSNNGIIEKYCYNNDPLNCAVYGGLYDWNEMMQYSNLAGGQGICPTGWHIPTDAELCTLSLFLDSQVNCSASGYSGVNAAGKMKETGLTHWSAPNQGATNESGFTALAAGYRYPYGYPGSLTQGIYIWASTEYDPTQGYTRNLGMYNANISRFHYTKYYGFTARCLKN